MLRSGAILEKRRGEHLLLFLLLLPRLGGALTVVLVMLVVGVVGVGVTGDAM